MSTVVTGKRQQQKGEETRRLLMMPSPSVIYRQESTRPLPSLLQQQPDYDA